jgi:uncharacterized protein
MLIELSQIPPEGLEVALPDQELDLGVPGGTWDGPVRVQANLHIARSGSDFVVTGSFIGGMRLVCGRCLEPFPFRAEDRFDLYCPLTTTGRTNDEHELTEDELDVTYVEEGRMNTDQLLRESVLLSLPVQPLCHEACRGLCPRCGANLNQGPCGCEDAAGDPRLQVLKKLL